LSEPEAAADDEALYRAYVGPRGQAYYLAYFARADRRGYAPIAWHWPALVFGVLWFLYRRLYFWALGLILAPYGIAALAAVVEGLVAGAGRIVSWTLLVGILLLWLPLQANAIYYRHARAAMAAVRRIHPGNRTQQIATLAAAGGVRPQAPVILVALLLLASLWLGATPQ
jgi:hypothetical protein